VTAGTAAPPPERRRPYLRDKLVMHVLWPLAMLWLVGNAVSAGIANHFAGRAFDRSLLDDAYALSAHVRLVGTSPPTLAVDLTANEIGTLLFDKNESNFFAIYRADGSLIAGQAGLPGSTRLVPHEPGFEFENLSFQGRSLRKVVLQQTAPVFYKVVVAQTVNSRRLMFRQLLIYSVLPGILLFALLAIWLYKVIRADLQPLHDLERAVQQRDESALSPLPIQAGTQDLVNLGGAINALLERIRISLGAQREFVGNVAHELRTPLAGIRALAEYGLQSSDPREWQRQLRLVHEVSLRSSHLTDQLLALALADEARVSLVREPVRLDELVTAAVIRASVQARADGVDLGADGVELPLTVMGSPALVEGMLNNLIDNALRYGRPRDGSMAEITVGLRQQGGQVELSVTDNGPGLSEEECEKLLARGVQGYAGRSLGRGLGLGLSIVTRYAQLLGAEFRLRRPPGGQGLQAQVLFGAPPEPAA
jgi:two-component system sensor histidine kinase TctE